MWSAVARWAGTRRNWFTIVALAAFVTFYVGLVTDPDAVWVGGMYPLVSCVSALGMLIGMRTHRPARTLGWILLAAGLIAFAGADLVYFVADVVTSARGAEPASIVVHTVDALYLTQYPLVGAALLVFIRQRTPGWHVATMLDTAVLVTGVALVWWVYVFVPVAGYGDLLLLAYPVLDVVILAMAMRLMLGGGARTVSYRLFLASVGVLLFGDAVVGVESAFGVEVVSPWTGGSWMLSCILLCAAALHPSMRTLDERASTTRDQVTLRRVIVLASATLLAPLVLSVEHARDHPAQTPVIACACAALFLLVVARMSGLVVEQREMASTDSLTGLRTRRYFADRLRAAGDRAGQAGAALSVVIMDADHFKSVNDTHGHPAGDAVLTELGERLRAVCRSTDVVARFGGEEFVVLMPDTPVEAAATVAERIRREVAERPIPVSETLSLPVTVSVGVASLGSHSATVEGLLRVADQALYAAKGHGRNCVVVGTDEEPLPASALAASPA